jgi:hypothetical protein
VWAGKASESEPVMKCRNALDDIETERRGLVRDEPGGYLSTAQVVSGMKLARARSGLWYGTWEPVTRYGRPFRWSSGHPVGESETSKRQNPQGAE